MAKPFDNAKRPQFWLNNQQTKDFLNALSKARNLALEDLVRITKGGNNPGTWMHEDVALEFARWLSPAFAIWCNDRIKELLLNGKVENNTFKSQRYVAGRNIMPGMHLPQLMSIGSQPVMAIHYNGNTYYRVKDIMKACDVWVTYKRKDISEPPFKKHIYWFSDSISNTGTPKRYFPIDGVMKLFSSIRRPTKQASQFMRAFAEHLHPTPTLIAQSGPYIDADRLLEVIVNTTKEKIGNFCTTYIDW